MTNSNTMEGLKRKNWKNSLKKTIQNKEIALLVVFILCGIIINGIVLQHLGPTVFIDSFKNPTAYTIVVTKEGSDKVSFVVQKTSHPDFSVKPNDELFCLTSYGTYDTIVATSSLGTYGDMIIGKIIERHKDNAIEQISFDIWCFMKDTMNPYMYID